jgi:hypothetical protein
MLLQVAELRSQGGFPDLQLLMRGAHHGDAPQARGGGGGKGTLCHVWALTEHGPATTANLKPPSIRHDPDRILHAKAEVGVAVHHASVDLRDIAVPVDLHLVDRVTVRQAHFVAAGQTIGRRL